jgi:N-acetylglucosamine kinase
MHVIGIDAGGSKTVCLLADEQGAILGDARGPGANLHSAGEAGVEEVLRAVIVEALDGRRVTLDAICIGMAGVDRDDEARAIRAVMRRIGHSRVIVVNDALIALVAGAKDADGIVIVAGTGSIVYGRNQHGQAARAGGWGHMIGDEGSGYWIGREALTAVMRAGDGRGPATDLTASVLGYFDVDDVSRLPRLVYDRANPRAGVAALGPIVARVADDGDAVAVRILERAAEELVLGARSVATRLDMRGDPFCFYLAGSIFRLVPRLAGELERRLVEVAPRSATAVLEAEPAEGAVWLALAEAHGGARVPRYR